MSANYITTFVLLCILAVTVVALVRSMSRDDEDARWRRIRKDYRNRMGRR